MQEFGVKPLPGVPLNVGVPSCCGDGLTVPVELLHEPGVWWGNGEPYIPWSDEWL